MGCRWSYAIMENPTSWYCRHVDKGFGIDGISIISKVQILLDANNSLWSCLSAKPESYSIRVVGVLCTSLRFANKYTVVLEGSRHQENNNKKRYPSLSCLIEILLYFNFKMSMFLNFVFPRFLSFILRCLLVWIFYQYGLKVISWTGLFWPWWSRFSASSYINGES